MTIEEKRRTKINNKCRKNKQIKLNNNYETVKELNNEGLVSNNTINLDLNVSDTAAFKNMINSNKTNNETNDSPKAVKCHKKGRDFVDIDSTDISKCYGCSAEKLKEQEPYILKDFK